MIYIAQLLTKCSVSTAQFAELKRDWSNRLLGSQALDEWSKTAEFSVFHSRVSVR